MLKIERKMQDEEQIELVMEEKKLEEEERRLERLKDEAIKTKTQHRNDLEKLQSQRAQINQQNEVDLQKQRTIEREAKDVMILEKQKLEGEIERRKAKKRITDLDLQTKEQEVDNLKARLQKEREDYETDFRDRQLRDLQIAAIKLEERRETISLREGDLRKKWRFLEKKRELLASDWETLTQKRLQLQGDKKEFEEWAGKIRETAGRLAEERDRVL